MNLELQILMCLRNAGESLLPESTLVAELRLVDREESLAQIKAALSKMEAKDQVNGVHNEDTGTKWKLADAGTIRLAEANL